MAYVWATWLPDVLRAAGLKVVTYPGWERRGLSASRSFVPTSVVWHHDASPKGDSPGVPAYMIRNFETSAAQLWVDRAGVWHVIAAGRAPHAGVTRPGMPTNSSSLGVETDHTVGEPWPPALLDSLRRGTAAILKRLSRPASSLHFHSLICDPPGRKIDPAGLSLSAERVLVGRLMAPSIPPTTDPTPPPRRARMIAFALGADLAAAIPLVDTHEVTTNPATASAAVKAGETVVAVGGPAIAALGWQSWAKPGVVTQSGKWVAVNGADRFATRRLAVGLLP